MNLLVPVSWLREYLKTDLAAKTIAGYLTASGPSVERIEKRGEDYIFDVEVTTNRPDAFSVFGIAREAYAILRSCGQKAELVPPKGINENLEVDKKDKLQLNVLIKNKSLCPRFTAVVIDDIKLGASPAIIKNRLKASGIRAINNIVDITNYIMLELGQPMHTFDYDKIRGAKMILRESEEGEKIKTLDGQVHKLKKGTIVIEDSGRLIDLCGIMGGENSQISRRTKRVVMFVQAYDPVRIRKTTQELAFRTEASARFEKAIDLQGIIPALKKAVYLTKKTAGAKIASELIDIYPDKIEPKPITLSFEKLNHYLGMDFPKEKAAKILELLGFLVKSTAQNLTATPPSYRTQDMEQEEDLIEEIARVHGYGNLPSKLPEGQIPQEEESDLQKVIELKGALKYLGLTEIISYSIISRSLLSLTGVDPKDAVELANPLTEEWQFMRPTLLVSLASIIGQNQNLRANIKIFEVAKTYIPFLSSSRQPKAAPPLAEMRGSDLPKQDLMLTVVLQDSDFYEIKGLVENLFEILGRIPSYSSSEPFDVIAIPSGAREKQSQGKLRESRSKKEVLDYARTINSALFEKSQSAQIKVGEQVIGTLGILNQSITDHFDIDQPVAAAEINLSTIYQLPTTNLSYRPIPKYPPVIEDLSAIFDEKTPIADIILAVTKSGYPLLKKPGVIDIYQNEKIGKGKKSVTLRLTYQRSDRTPTHEEVSLIREKIIKQLQKSLAAIVRRL